MRIVRLRLEDWRNFRAVDLRLGSRLFVLGPNAAGKSNLLDAVLFLHEIATVPGGLQAAVAAPRRGGMAGLRCLFHATPGPVTVDIETEGDGPGWRYRLTFDARADGRAVVRREAVWRLDGPAAVPVLDRPGPAEAGDADSLLRTHLEQPGANRSFRALAEGLRSVRGMPGTAGDGDLIGEIAATPPAERTIRLNRMQTVLQLAMPQLEALDFEAGDGQPHLRVRATGWPPGCWQREGHLSEGTLRLMALVWALLIPGGPLLVEEPERSLHPAVAAQLAPMIWRATRRSGRQSLIATHSEAVLSDEGIGLDEVVVLVPGPAGTAAHCPADDPAIRAMRAEGLPLAEAVLPLGQPREAGRLPLSAADWGG
jgi:predicted ATPase